METDPWGGARVGFEGSTSISRKDWGIDFNIPSDSGRLLVGDRIEIKSPSRVCCRPPQRRAQLRRSSTIAMPWPPPTHIVINPVCLSWVCNELIKVFCRRAPVIPNG